MDAKQHIERARELAAQAEEELRPVSAIRLPSAADLIALGRLHAEIAHADATSDVAYFTRAREERERPW